MGVSETTGKIVTVILLLSYPEIYTAQTTRELSQRIVTLPWSGSGAGTHFRSGSHLRIKLPIIIRARSEVFPYFANAKRFAICPLNRTPTCAKFWKAINRGSERSIPKRRRRKSRARSSSLARIKSRVNRNPPIVTQYRVLRLYMLRGCNKFLCVSITHNRWVHREKISR